MPDQRPVVSPAATLSGLADRIEQGFQRQADAVVAALLMTWTGLALTAWTIPFGAVVGAVAGIIGGDFGLARDLHLGTATGFAAALLGLAAGALGGFLLVAAPVFTHLPTLAGCLAGGAIIAACTTLATVIFEDAILRFRGLRHLSEREHRLLDPIVRDLLDRMGIDGVGPALYMSDNDKPEASTFPRSIVIGRGLLAYDVSTAPPTPNDRAALTAVLAHELAHWRNADAFGTRIVWTCMLPLVGMYNLAQLFRDRRGWVGLFGWVVFWPAYVTTQLVVRSVMSERMREAEFEADAAAAALGDDIRLGLRAALHELRDWEVPRTGWEKVLHATHPPIELRLDHLSESSAPLLHRAVSGAIPPRPTRKKAAVADTPRLQATETTHPVAVPPRAAPADLVEQPDDSHLFMDAGIDVHQHRAESTSGQGHGPYSVIFTPEGHEGPKLIVSGSAIQAVAGRCDEAEGWMDRAVDPDDVAYARTAFDDAHFERIRIALAAIVAGDYIGGDGSPPAEPWVAAVRSTLRSVLDERDATTLEPGSASDELAGDSEPAAASTVDTDLTPPAAPEPDGDADQADVRWPISGSTSRRTSTGRDGRDRPTGPPADS